MEHPVCTDANGGSGKDLDFAMARKTKQTDEIIFLPALLVNATTQIRD